MERQCAAEGVVGDEEQPQPEKAQSDPDPATNTSSSREEPQPTRTAFKTPRGHEATPASPPSRPDGSHQGKPKTPAGEQECPPTRQRRGAVAGRGRWGPRAFFGCVVCMLFFRYLIMFDLMTWRQIHSFQLEGFVKGTLCPPICF
jgi:hypothetical protein